MSPCVYRVRTLWSRQLRVLGALLSSHGRPEVAQPALFGAEEHDSRREISGNEKSPPPSDEQAAIVRFLDWANGRLERAIRAKRKVIALLNEQKQAIIHRAVTRGLDPPSLNPSGIPWLGDIPQHWQVRRLKSVLLTGRLTNGVFKRGDAFGSGVPLVNVADIYAPDGTIRRERLEKVRATPDEVETFRVVAGDLFFVRSSLKLEGTGRCAFAEALDADTVFECRVRRADRPDQRRIVTDSSSCFSVLGPE